MQKRKIEINQGFDKRHAADASRRMTTALAPPIRICLTSLTPILSQRHPNELPGHPSQPGLHHRPPCLWNLRSPRQHLQARQTLPSVVPLPPHGPPLPPHGPRLAHHTMPRNSMWYRRSKINNYIANLLFYLFILCFIDFIQNSLTDRQTDRYSYIHFAYMHVDTCIHLVYLLTWTHNAHLYTDLYIYIYDYLISIHVYSERHASLTSD